MNLYILDRKEKIKAILTDNSQAEGYLFFDGICKENLKQGSHLEFKTDCINSEVVDSIKNENFVVAQLPNGKIKEFILKEVHEEHTASHTLEAYAECSSIELLDSIYLEDLPAKRYEVDELVKLVLKGTRWQAGEIQNVNNRYIKEDFKGKNVLELLNLICKKFDMEIDFSIEFTGNKITKRLVTVKREIGGQSNRRLVYNHNLTEIKREIVSTDIKTAVYPVGKDGLTIEGISWSKPNNPLDKPKGVKMLEDLTATEKYGIPQNDGTVKPREIYIEFSEVESVTELINLAHLQLRRFTAPKVTYSAELLDLYRLTGDIDYKAEAINLGCSCSILDTKFSEPLCLFTRVVEIEHDLNNPEQTKITLGTLRPTLVDKDVATLVKEAVEKDSENIIDTEELKKETIQALTGEFNQLIANKVDVKDLNAVKISVETLKADSITTKDLQAVKGKFDSLEADFLKVKTEVAGHLSAENFQAGSITSDKLTIADGFIKNAMIEYITASKINTGAIDTGKVTVKSSDGALTITGATQQFRDKNGVVRVQIGQDEKGDFNFLVLDETGKGTLISATGVHEGAIGEGLIKTKHIDEGAVTGDKIDLVSVVNRINNDKTGKSTIKASKVQIDGQAQTLDVSFKQMDTKLKDLKAGTRNLFIGGAKEFITKNEYLGIPIISITEPRVEKYLSISFDLKASKPCDMVVYFLGKHAIDRKVFKAGVDYQRVSFVSKVSNNDLKQNWTSLSVYGTYKTGNIPTIKNLMIVESNIPVVDYVPAPEETEESIKTLDTEIKTVNGKLETAVKESEVIKGAVTTLKDSYTKIEQDKESIKREVAKQQTILDTQSGAIKETESKINKTVEDLEGTKQEISTVKSQVAGAVTKTEQQYTEITKSTEGIKQRVKAVEELNEAIDGDLEAYKRRVQEVETKVTKDAIINSVSSTITDKINAIQIGGANLVHNGNFTRYWENKTIGWDNNLNGIYKVNDWYTYNSGVDGAKTGYHTHLVISESGGIPEMVFNNVTGRWLGLSQSLYRTESDFRANQQYTVSMDIKFMNTEAKATGGLYYKNKKDNKSAFYSGEMSFKADATQVNKWTRFSHTFTLKDFIKEDEKVVDLYVYGHTGGKGLFFVKNVKVEEGNKATPFCLNAFELKDIAKSEVTELRAETQVKLDSITSTVKGKADSSTVQQTADSWKATFEKSGAVNLIKNSRPTKTRNYWSCSNGGSNNSDIQITTGGENWNNEYFKSGLWFRVGKKENVWTCAVNNSFKEHKFDVSKKYTISFPLYCNKGGKTLRVFIGDLSSRNQVGGCTVKCVSEGYQQVNYTFTPAQTGNIPHLMLFAEELGEYNFYIPYISMYISDKPRAWSPAPDEVYSGCITLDGEGVRCDYKDGSYTSLNKEGFTHYIAGAEHPYHALFTQGVVNNLSFNNGVQLNTVQLPDEFKGRKFYIQTMIQGWNFVSGSDGVPWTLASGVQGTPDYANARFNLYLNSGKNERVNVNVAYTVIA